MAHPTNPKFAPIRGLLIGMVLFGIGWTLFHLHTDVVNATSSSSGMAQQLTPTPLPTEISEEVVREGQPTGIIVGAVAIVLLILLGTAPFLLRTARRGDPD